MVRLADYQNREILRLEQELTKMKKMVQEQLKQKKEKKSTKPKRKNRNLRRVKDKKRSLKLKKAKARKNKLKKRLKKKQLKKQLKKKSIIKKNNKKPKEVTVVAKTIQSEPKITSVQKDKNQALIAETRSQIKISKVRLAQITPKQTKKIGRPTIKSASNRTNAVMKAIERKRALKKAGIKNTLKRRTSRGSRRKHPCPYCPGGGK